MERNQRAYNKLIRAVRPVLVRRFGKVRAEQILQDAGPVYSRFLEEAPRRHSRCTNLRASLSALGTASDEPKWKPDTKRMDRGAIN